MRSTTCCGEQPASSGAGASAALSAPAFIPGEARGHRGDPGEAGAGEIGARERDAAGERVLRAQPGGEPRGKAGDQRHLGMQAAAARAGGPGAGGGDQGVATVEAEVEHGAAAPAGRRGPRGQ